MGWKRWAAHLSRFWPHFDRSARGATEFMARLLQVSFVPLLDESSTSDLRRSLNFIGHVEELWWAISLIAVMEVEPGRVCSEGMPVESSATMFQSESKPNAEFIELVKFWPSCRLSTVTSPEELRILLFMGCASWVNAPLSPAYWYSRLP